MGHYCHYVALLAGYGSYIINSSIWIEREFVCDFSIIVAISKSNLLILYQLFNQILVFCCKYTLTMRNRNSNYFIFFVIIIKCICFFIDIFYINPVIVIA